jgi:hypothetical protein
MLLLPIGAMRQERMAAALHETVVVVETEDVPPRLFVVAEAATEVTSEVETREMLDAALLQLLAGMVTAVLEVDLHLLCPLLLPKTAHLDTERKAVLQLLTEPVERIDLLVLVPKLSILRV